MITAYTPHTGSECYTLCVDAALRVEALYEILTQNFPPPTFGHDSLGIVAELPSAGMGPVDARLLSSVVIASCSAALVLYIYRRKYSVESATAADGAALPAVGRYYAMTSNARPNRR
jgi:hypothetical protein